MMPTPNKLLIISTISVLLLNLHGSTRAVVFESLTVIAATLKVAYLELIMFSAAALGYLLFSGTGMLVPSQPRKKHTESYVPTQQEKVSKQLEIAYSKGDFTTVLQLWSQLKIGTNGASVNLPSVIDSMKKLKADNASIFGEIRSFLENNQKSKPIHIVNGVMDSLAKAQDLELLKFFFASLAELKLKPDHRSFEALITCCFNMRKMDEIQKALAEMTQRGMPLTCRIVTILIKSAVKRSDFTEAFKHFVELKKMKGSSAGVAAVVPQVVSLACREHRLPEILLDVHDAPISTEVVHAMLDECVRLKDSELCQKVEAIGRGQKVTFKSTTYLLLIKGLSARPHLVHSLYEEMVNSGIKVTESVGFALLNFCTTTRNAALAAKVYSLLKETCDEKHKLSLFTGIVKVYAQCEQYEAACDIFVQDMQPSGTQADSNLTGLLMNCAVECGRQDLAQSLFDKSPCDVAKHLTMIRSAARDRDLPTVMSVFNKLTNSNMPMNTVIYNCLLDAVVQCGELRRALKLLDDMKRDSMADVVSYNTLIKAYLNQNQLAKARAVIGEMKAQGIVANRITYNELLNAVVQTKDRRAMWSLLEEMRGSGIVPNHYTCSILLKSLNAHSHPSDVVRTMELIENIDDPMDEVLFSSVLEACIRIGKPDLLSAKLKQHAAAGGLVGITAPTYGSMIKAYAQCKDMEKVWELWREMRARDVKPTAVTLGCMVDALVCSGENDAAWDLICEMRDADGCREVVNTVIYSTVLKGFAQQKLIDRAWFVYQEMRTRKVECNTVTYNTLMDACARSGQMQRVPGLFSDMRIAGVEPDVITYSAVVKGYCMAGDINRALDVLQEMKTGGRFAPDEILYNSLLDGCGKHGLLDKALSLLEEMQRNGITPSNFTLSILVKQLGRARRLNQAFSLVERICQQYGFTPNVHVYTTLIGACGHNRQLSRALQLHDSMIAEGVMPDAKTYTVLNRACLFLGHLEKAVMVARTAYGIKSPGLTPARRPPGLERKMLEELLMTLCNRHAADKLAAPLLQDLKNAGVTVDRGLQSRVMQCSISDERGAGARRPRDRF